MSSLMDNAPFGRMKKRRSLEEVLKSASDVLFPAEMGEAVVTVNSRDACGDTPLHVMAWRSDRDAVRLLVESGADLNAVGDMSETPLHVAAKRVGGEMYELFKRHAARQTAAGDGAKRGT